MEKQEFLRVLEIEHKTPQKTHKERRKVTLRFCVFIAGFICVCGPYMAVLGLQSSMNIKENIGTLSLGIGYAVSTVFSILCIPILIRKLGSKTVLIAGECCYLLYVAANFYPVSSLMITAGILLGIAEASVWTNIPLFNTYFGECDAKVGTKSVASYAQKYNGIFFGSFQAGLILGNACLYAILRGQSGDVESIIQQNKTNYFEHCGSNDCQNPNVTYKEIDRYVPDQLSIYILLGLFCALCLCGLFLHIRFLPDPTDRKRAKKVCKVENGGDYKENKILSMGMKDTLLETWKHQINPKQILLVPYLFYFGNYVGFIYGELMRAYVSCILGVEQVGLVVIIYSAVSGISSILSRKSISLFGRNKLLLILFCVDVTNYLFCLLWNPEDRTTWLVYIMFSIFALTDGKWKTTILSVYNDYFSKNLEIAFVIWILWITIGKAVQFGWSPLMCVSTKICIQLGLLVTSMICYSTAELIHRSQTKVSKEAVR